MCCEICPRYTNCEEEGHLNDLCCVSCSDYSSCYEDNQKDKDGDNSEDELGEV